jgi:hypothetical protein
VVSLPSKAVRVSTNRFHGVGELAQVTAGPRDRIGFELSEAIVTEHTHPLGQPTVFVG